jgi:hypothetical protein
MDQYGLDTSLWLKYTGYAAAHPVYLVATPMQARERVQRRYGGARRPVYAHASQGASAAAVWRRTTASVRDPETRHSSPQRKSCGLEKNVDTTS